jgi:hypothetical protein
LKTLDIYDEEHPRETNNLTKAAADAGGKMSSPKRRIETDVRPVSG